MSYAPAVIAFANKMQEGLVFRVQLGVLIFPFHCSVGNLKPLQLTVLPC